ncbi:MAG: GAP family protein, partial [Mycobacteriaceae bacterium]|nr:GAP family protein [Mycobacteriaceae bacterium]
ILHWGSNSANADHPHRWIVSTVLLVVALLFLITAAREFFSGDDPSAPPPKWMTLLTSATPTKAFLIGAGIMTISIKSWVLTLAAISAIGHAELTRVENVVCYVGFVVLATGGNLFLVCLAGFFPDQSDALLERMLRWLRGHDRPILIVVGLAFGLWFGVKALHGFGIG